MKTPYETVRLLARPLLPTLQSLVAKDLSRLTKQQGDSFRLLDVGGRSSPYTCGLRAEISIMDLPRQSDVQNQLNLGVDGQMLRNLKQRRSNINQVHIQDLVTNTMPAGSFNGVSAIEVIEHVPEDRLFVEQARRLVEPGGWLYLTTPNGDYLKNEGPGHNPDHLRHYTRRELDALLNRSFREVNVTYAVRTGRNRALGLRSITPAQPLAALSTMASNLLNQIESRNVDQQASRTAHLIAIAR